MTTTDSTIQIDVRLDFDTRAAAFSRAMAHLDTAATKELDRVDFDHRLRELVSVRERAALAFTEVVTLVADSHVPTEAYDAVAAHFRPDEVSALLSLIVTINAWNAIAVTTRA